MFAFASLGGLEAFILALIGEFNSFFPVYSLLTPHFLRFKHINSTAREALVLGGYLNDLQNSKKTKK